MLSFPSGPRSGQSYVAPNGQIYVWDGVKWLGTAISGGAVTTGGGSTYSWSIAADDSTQREIFSSESVKFTGAGGITTSSDAEGNITITGSGGGTVVANPYQFFVASDDSTQRLVSTDEVIKFTGVGAIATGSDAEGNITITNTYQFFVAADDSAQRLVSTDEVIKFIGAGGITTSSDAEGNITITGSGGGTTDWNNITNKPNIAGTYQFYVAADDSTQRLVSSDEVIKFIGAGGITTTSDAEGNITITGTAIPTLATVATSGSYTDLINKPNIAGTYQFYVAADDSTQRLISTDELIKFTGAGGITTSSDAEGYITITQGTTSSLVNGAKTVSLDSTGLLTLPNDSGIRSATNIDITIQTPDSSTFNWQFGEDGTTLFPNQAIDGGTAPIELKSRSWSQLTYNNVDMTPAPNKNHSTTFYVEGGDALLEIFRWDGASALQHQQWTFSYDGKLTLPTGAVIFDNDGPGGGWVTIAPANAGVGQALAIYPTAGGDGDHIHLTANGGSTELYLGNDDQYVKLVNGGNVEIKATTSDSAASSTWTFGTGGLLSLGASVGGIYANQTTGIITIGDNIAPNGAPYAPSTVIQIGGATNAFLISAYGPPARSWTFGMDGALTVPGDIKSSGNINIDINLTDSTLRRWSFGEDGFLNVAGPIVLPNNGELRPSSTAYDAALAGWEFIRGGEIAYKIANNIVTAEGWPMVDWYPTGVTAQGYIDFLFNARAVQNAGGTLIIYPAMSADFYQQMRAALIAIRNTYNLYSGGVSLSSAYGKSWNFSETGDLTIPGSIRSDTGLYIDVNLADSTLRRWQFGEDGNLTFPNGNSYIGPKYSANDNWLVTPSDNGGGVASADGQQYIQITNDDGVIIGTSYGVNHKQFTFGRAGQLILPGDIWSEGNINIQINTADSTKQIWQFGEDGNLTFPDGTNQTTAWTGSGGTTLPTQTGNSGKYLTTDGSTLSWATVAGGGGGGSTLVNGAFEVSLGATGNLTIPGDILSENEINIDINLSDSTLRRWTFGQDGELSVPGNINTTATTFTLANTTATTVNAFGAATVINIGSSASASLTINPGTIIGANTTQALFNTGATVLNFAGAATTLTIANGLTSTTAQSVSIATGSNTGTKTINIGTGGGGATITLGIAASGSTTIASPSIQSSAATVSLFTSTSTNISFATAATTLAIGSTGAGAITTLNAPTVIGSATTQNLYNTVATTVNEFGAATAINVATNAASATTWTLGNPNNTNTLTVAGGTAGGTDSISSTVTTGVINVFTGLTTGTLNIATGSGTAINIGGSGSTVTVGNNLTVTGPVTSTSSVGVTAVNFNTDQLTITGNRISTTVTNANLEIEPNGTGGVVITAGVTAETFNTDQLTITGNRISTTVTNANLELECNGTGGVVINRIADATTASTAKSVGYLGVPASTVTTSSTLTIADAGEHVYVNSASQTITIPANSSVAYPVGTTITFIAGPSATTVSIAITTDTMYLAGTGTTGSRTLAAYGMATAIKVAATTWFINGTGLT